VKKTGGPDHLSGQPRTLGGARLIRLVVLVVVIGRIRPVGEGGAWRFGLGFGDGLRFVLPQSGIEGDVQQAADLFDDLTGRFAAEIGIILEIVETFVQLGIELAVIVLASVVVLGFGGDCLFDGVVKSVRTRDERIPISAPSNRPP
jgi:hypothetical protein